MKYIYIKGRLFSSGGRSCPFLNAKDPFNRNCVAILLIVINGKGQRHLKLSGDHIFVDNHFALNRLPCFDHSAQPNVKLVHDPPHRHTLHILVSPVFDKELGLTAWLKCKL